MSKQRRVAISESDASIAATLVMDEAEQVGTCLGRLVCRLAAGDALGIRIYMEAAERHADAWLLAARIHGRRQSLAFLSGALDA